MFQLLFRAIIVFLAFGQHSVASVSDRLDPRSLLPQKPEAASFLIAPYLSDSSIPRDLLLLASTTRNADNQLSLKKTPDQAIYLNRGVFDLSTLLVDVDSEGVLKGISGGTYQLRIPIIIRPNASLVIDQVTLQMISENPVFILNYGKLFVLESHVASWNDVEQKVQNLASENVALPWLVRGFVWTHGDGEFYAFRSKFEGLGQPGLDLTSGIRLSAAKLSEDSVHLNWVDDTYEKSLAGEPEGHIVQSEFHNNYIGLWAKQNRKMLVQGNTFKNNIQTHLRLQEIATPVDVLGNIFHQTLLGDGAYFSGIPSLTLRDNLFSKNKNDGLSLYNVGDIEVKGNFYLSNERNGINIKQIESLTLVDNQFLANAGDGAKIVQVSSFMVKNNQFRQNAFYGLKIGFAADTTGQAQIGKGITQQGGGVVGNLFVENFAGAMSALGPQITHYKANVSQGIGSRKIAGDLQSAQGIFWQQNDTPEGFVHCNLTAEACLL